MGFHEGRRGGSPVPARLFSSTRGLEAIDPAGTLPPYDISRAAALFSNWQTTAFLFPQLARDKPGVKLRQISDLRYPSSVRHLWAENCQYKRSAFAQAPC